LRGPLRAWGEDLLAPAALAEGGLLDAREVRRRWDAHQRGRADHQHALWVALSIAAWQRRTGIRT
jgi:asparagine synthase (glutamine-hydrolysing)